MSNPSSTVLITGANRGIGLEFTRQYLADGWRVIAACRDPGRAEALRALGESARLTTIALDVTNAASIAEAARALATQPIDLLVNNAGTMGGPGQALGHIDYPDWMHVLEINTLGPVRMLEAFADHLARSTRRLAVTLSSAMGSIGQTTSGSWIAYRSSKAALNMANKCAALELAGRGISCIVMSPGWVRTDMGGAQATLSPEQSVAAMRRVIGALGVRDSGRFLNYDGREYSW